MRIIAGQLGGRQFGSPRNARTHPMSEKMRGALFNALGDISGLRVLDAFSGTGALGFEALSRGAARVTAIENDHAAQKVITQNTKTLGLTANFRLIHGSVESWLATRKEQLELVLADPPYDNVRISTLQRLAEHSNVSGVIVFSLPPELKFRLSTSFELLSTKNYGDAKLEFYRRIS